MPLSHTFTIRFFSVLNIFLAPEKKKITFSHTIKGKPSIKDTVEALGVPHTEIDCILVNGKPVDFNYLIQGGEKIRVYPAGAGNRRGRPCACPNDKWRPQGAPLQPRFPYRPRFLADVHLGKLARHLRLLGFDTLYERDYADPQIIERIKGKKRIVLTRDIGLLKNKAVRYGYFVQAIDATRQIKEVVKRFHLSDKVKPFTLCLDCNGRIYRTAKAKVLHKLPPATKEFYAAFYACRSCGKVYWKGAHHRRLVSIIRSVMNRGQVL